MSAVWRKLQTPIYTNSGSTARDHLASERTFLAWLRTGLGFIALGIAIERFSTLEPLIKKAITSIDAATSTSSPTADERKISPKSAHTFDLATSFTGLGATAILYGTQRYIVNLRMLQKGMYKPAYWGAGIFVVSVIGVSGYGIWDTFSKRQRQN